MMRVLILEDDPLIALDLECIVEDCGHTVAVHCDRIDKIDAHLGEGLDFALLDVDLPDGKSFGVASRLLDMKIAFAFVSAARSADLPDHLRHARFIAKPYQPAAIRHLLQVCDRLAS